MAGGRPPEGKQQRYPELEELASWFHRALTGAGYRSVNEFLSRGLFEKNAVYGVFGAARLLTLESTQALAVALKRTPAQVVPIWTRAKEARDRATLAAERAQAPRVTSWANYRCRLWLCTIYWRPNAPRLNACPTNCLTLKSRPCRACTCGSRCESGWPPTEVNGRTLRSRNRLRIPGA